MKGWERIKQLICLLAAFMFFDNGWAAPDRIPNAKNPARFYAAIFNLVLSESYIKIVSVGQDANCVDNGDTVEFVAVVKYPDKSHQIEWEHSGDGNIQVHSDGKKAAYTAPLSGHNRETLSASVVYTDTLETDTDQITFYYGACPNVAVFHRITGSYNQPGLDSSCDTLIQGGDQYEYTNDNPNNDGKNPEIPLNRYWNHYESSEYYKNLESVDPIRGTPGVGGVCSLGSFPANSEHYSLALLTPEGAVKVASRLNANAACFRFPTGELECSSANTGTEFHVVYEMYIDKAVDYRVNANLVCSGRPHGIPIPAITIVLYRYNKNGDLITPDVIQPFFSPPCDDNSSIVESNNVVSLSAPADDGVDRVVVQFVIFNAAVARPDTDGVLEDASELRGAVNVSPVQN